MNALPTHETSVLFSFIFRVFYILNQGENAKEQSYLFLSDCSTKHKEGRFSNFLQYPQSEFNASSEEKNTWNII
jgi:hypothetical protein